MRIRSLSHRTKKRCLSYIMLLSPNVTSATCGGRYFLLDRLLGPPASASCADAGIENQVKKPALENHQNSTTKGGPGLHRATWRTLFCFPDLRTWLCQSAHCPGPSERE